MTSKQFEFERIPRDPKTGGKILLPSSPNVHTVMVGTMLSPEEWVRHHKVHNKTVITLASEPSR